MKRPKLLILTASIVLACLGLALACIHHAHLRRHGHGLSAVPATPFPGNSTPESALQSLGWAAGNGDIGLLRAGLTPAFRQKLDAAGPNMEAQAMHEASKLPQAKILNKEVLSSDQVLLYVQTSSQELPQKFVMQRINQQWKFADQLP